LELRMAMRSGVPQSVRRRVFRRDDYLCIGCGLIGWERRCERGGFSFPTSEPGIFLSIDHIQPRDEGGSNDESNLRTLCTRCNARKGTLPNLLWMARRLAFNKERPSA
jgi:5-methylcytosine-specific restriction endonuclease McrA